MRTTVSVLLSLAALTSPVMAADSLLPHCAEVYAGWLKMYDLKFDAAHQIFVSYQQSYPSDALGPASDAAAYLFSELACLGALEAELFVDDNRFANRSKLQPDANVRLHFTQQIDRADLLADSALQKSSRDANALFVKSLTYGLRADYAGLVDKRNLAALIYTNKGRAYADKLLAVDSNAFDAHLGPGIENYLLSFKPAPLRALLRLTGSGVDREKGIEELQVTALHGYYLEPFAKLLLAVAALRNGNREQASALLTGLRDRFPDNELFSRELSRVNSTAR
jgi:hypothetical protein